MNNDNINISSILTHLDKVIRKHVCKQCYAGTLPSTLSEKVTSYVLIEPVNAIYDYSAYGKGIINIYLYAKPFAKGIMNVAELSKLEKALSKAMNEDLFDSDAYKVPRETAYSDSGYDSTYGMHYIIKAIRVTIL